MGFVKTSAEIQQLERKLARPEFVSGERLTIEFLTDPSLLAGLLPPPLEPAGAPLVLASVGRWQSNCVGDYAGGSIYLTACHGSLEGAYALTMFMDSEPAVIFGREVFGEPKKFAASALFRRDDHFHGYLERHGIRVLELHADLGADLGESQAEAYAFNYKARPAAHGVGLEGPASLTRARFETTVKARREGTGTVELRSTVHDPLAELPVVSVVRAYYTEHDISASCETVASVPAEQFLAYHHGRTDNWLALDSTASQGAKISLSARAASR
jgi:acetoacetate decarboxylase